MTPVGGNALASRWLVCVGIDPGSTTGMICVAVDRDRPDMTQGRLVGEALAKIGAFGKLDETLHLRKRVGTLGNAVYKQVKVWSPDIIVVENPTEAMPIWGQQPTGVGDPRTVLQIATGAGSAGKPKSRVMGASRGTIANLGVHLGIVATCAAVAVPSAELYAYHVMAIHDKKRRRGHVGWMRGMKRGRVLDEMGYLLRTLRARPHSGILPKREAVFETPDENILMALGVLNFHFQHVQRGATTWPKNEPLAVTALAAADGPGSERPSRRGRGRSQRNSGP